MSSYVSHLPALCRFHCRQYCHPTLRLTQCRNTPYAVPSVYIEKKSAATTKPCYKLTLYWNDEMTSITPFPLPPVLPPDSPPKKNNGTEIHLMHFLEFTSKRNQQQLLKPVINSHCIEMTRWQAKPRAHTVVWQCCKQRRSQEFDLGKYKLHDIEFVLGQGDKTTTWQI